MGVSKKEKALLQDGCHLLLIFHDQDSHKRFELITNEA